MKIWIFCCALLGSQFAFSQNNLPEVVLRSGMVITQSCKIKAGTYRFDVPKDTLAASNLRSLIQVKGDGITIDFQGAEIRSTADSTRPDLFAGIAIQLSGKGILVKNVKVRGFKIALLAKATESVIEQCDFSYNYRPRLLSTWAKENEADWLSYSQNEGQEWLRHGAGIYLWQCKQVTVRDCKISACQNALLLSGSTDCTIYNNFFTFNSGLGVGLYRSSNNRVMHNRLDWNVRGYSNKQYARGHDSASLLCFEQSSNNTFAYNSCTHSGNGFFLWGGQSTLDSGVGGSNDNVVFGNDFSQSVMNGVEATFSRNRISGNLIKECTYGIWAGYSFDSEISGNWIAESNAGIAIEHGQKNTIRQNLITDNQSGILLWERAEQPKDWKYTQKRDVRSRDTQIDRNVFLNNKKPFKIGSSKNIRINGENLFFDFEQLLETPHPNDSLVFLRNDIYGNKAELEAVWANPAISASRGLNFSHESLEAPANPYAPLEVPVLELREPDSLAGGMLAVLPAGFPRGRQYIIMDEWGPFNFKRPIAAVDFVSANKKNIDLTVLGPSGDFKVIATRGIEGLSHRNGQVPQEIKAIVEAKATEIWIQFEYNGPETVTDLHGNLIPSGKNYVFELRFELR